MIVLHRLCQQLVVLRQYFLAAVLLEDDQVAAHLGVGVLREEVVGHSHHRQQVGIPHHQEAGAVVALAVQHALRGEEGDDAAVTHGIDSFKEKVVVYLLRRCPVHEGALLILRIEYGDVAEGNVGQGKVEMAVERSFYFLKTFYTHFPVGMKMAEHPARQQVLLESHHIGLGGELQHGIYKRSHACRWFQQPYGHDAVPRKHACEGICDFLRGIEGREHGAFQRIDITLVFHLVTAILTDKAVEFRRGGKEFEVGFRPVDGIRQFLGGIKNALQASEAAVPAQYIALGLGRGTPFPVKEECRPYRLDVVPQSLLAVKRHTRPDRVRQLPSVRCTAGHSPTTGRNGRRTGRRWRTRCPLKAATSWKGLLAAFRGFHRQTRS